MELEKFETSLKIPISYVHLNKNENKPLVIFLHGFADTARSLLKRSFDESQTEVEVLAINGPFPVPQKKEGKWKQAYSWYFIDFYTREVYIHPNVAATAIQNLLIDLKLEKRPKIIVGFSQGGFFVPHLLKHISHVKEIFTVGSVYRAEDYPDHKIKLHALHGEKDQIVSFAQGQESFKDLLQKKSVEGNFKSLPDMGHNFTDEARQWLKSNILRAAKGHEAKS